MDKVVNFRLATQLCPAKAGLPKIYYLVDLARILVRRSFSEGGGLTDYLNNQTGLMWTRRESDSRLGNANAACYHCTTGPYWARLIV